MKAIAPLTALVVPCLAVAVLLPVAATAEPVPSDVAPTVLDVRVRAGTDDAEERSTGAVLTGSGDLNLGREDSVAQTVGMRFTGVTVPRGATVTSAYVQFTADEVKTAAASLVVAGQASDNPLRFTTASRSVSTRPRTAASVAWSPAPWPTVGARTADQRTPDIRSVVQEVVGRADWASGDPIVLLVTGTGERAADSYEGGATKAPLLHVEYLPSPPDPGTADTTAPETALTAAPSGTVADRSASFSFSSSEAGSGFECSLDTAPFGACTSPRAYSDLADGTHTFAVRATDAAGNVDATPATASWTVAGADVVTPPPTGGLPGSIAGIEPEAHSHVPPYADGNGNLYRVTEEYYSPVPNYNSPRMMRSADGGRTWSEVDAANRPTDRDLEGSWLLQSGTSLVYVHTNGARVTYSEFLTSDAPTTPDRWVVRNERGITGLAAGSRQWACAARTRDGRTWVFFSDTVVGGNMQLAFMRRNAAGSWTPKTRISTDAESLAGASCVVDPATDVTHVVYHDYARKQVLARTLSPGGELSPAVRVDTTGTSTATLNYHAVTNPVVYSFGGSTVLTAMYASASGVRAVSVVDGVVGAEEVVDPAAPLISPPNTDKNTGNDGPVMHLAVDGSTVHAVWAVASTGDVWHSRRPHGGAWTTPVRLVDSGAGHVSWLYSNVLRLGGVGVLGYTYDLGPHPDDGGDIRFDRVPL